MEERRLRVCENRVMRRIFGPKGVEVTWEWRKVHDEELKDVHCSHNILKVKEFTRFRFVEHVA